MSDEKMFESVKKAMKKLASCPNVVHPGNEELRAMAEEFGTRTEFGNYNFSTSVKNRSAGLTVYLGDEEVKQSSLNERQKKIIEKAPETVELVHHYLKKAPIVSVERKIGDNPEFSPLCRLYVSVYRRDSVRLPYMWSLLLPPPEGAVGPEFHLLYIPEWHESQRQILVFPEEGVTYVLGSDYLGEAKKGFLRLAMWHAKKRGMLGLHAGAKILRARDPEGKIRRYCMLLFGLSGTGKTTHTCHNHNLTGEGEGVEIVQDDVVFLKKDGAVLGTETGFFLKTDIHPESQPLIYQAATSPDAVLENVLVDYQGKVHFLDETITSNGRGVILRKDLGEENITPTLDVPPLKELDGLILAYITRRNTIIPLVSKLNPEQAAAYFMLGESIETSAGDPTRIGESVRVVGANPFIIGNEAEEGNWIYEFVKNNPNRVQCYLLNTGGVGEIMVTDKNGNKKIVRKVKRVEISEMAQIIKGIAKGTIKWKKNPYFGNLMPAEVEGMDINKYDPEKFYTKEEIEEMAKKLQEERKEYLKRFKGLNPNIRI